MNTVVELHPVRVVLSDDRRRFRLAVLFRSLLAIPHYIWWSLWSFGVLFAVLFQWFVLLARGRPAGGLHRFTERYVRYTVHLTAYLFLAANPYPPFDGGEGGYPLDLVPVEPQRQGRAGVLFRAFLAIPFVILEGALTSGGIRLGPYTAVFALFGPLGIAAIFGWFAALVTGRMPRGLRDFAVYAIAYQAQVHAYLLLVTDRFPSSEPGLVPVEAATPGTSLTVSDDLRRSRLTVLFRYLLSLPHIVWLLLWGIAALAVAIATWFAALVKGRPPAALHRFLARYVRYQLHVSAYLYLVANPFPGFGGLPGTYPVDVHLPEPRRQHRVSILFRGLLVLPAVILVSAFGSVLGAAAVLAWFFALVMGRTQPGLRNLGAAILRVQAETYAYALLVGSEFPYLGFTTGRPSLPEFSPEPIAA